LNDGFGFGGGRGGSGGKAEQQAAGSEEGVAAGYVEWCHKGYSVSTGEEDRFTAETQRRGEERPKKGRIGERRGGRDRRENAIRQAVLRVGEESRFTAETQRRIKAKVKT
jgi:hypothetical protein